MKNRDGNISKNTKYRTHPIVKALLSLFLVFALFSAAAVYFMYLYTVGVASEYEKKYAAVRYGAYLELCEKLGENDAEGAEEALSRFYLFLDGSGKDHGNKNKNENENKNNAENEEILLNYLRNGALTEEESMLLYEIFSENGDDVEFAVKKATEAIFDRVHERSTEVWGGNDSEWRTLRERAEVTEKEARDVARRFIGGGAQLTSEKSGTFPLVYVFSCENAIAEISRMGGRLLTLWRYPLGELSERSDEACRSAAREFVYESGITGAYLTEERKIYAGNESVDEIEAEAETETEYIFCGTCVVGDEEALMADERVEVRVAKSGARITGFDAREFYRHRGNKFSGKIEVTRGEAAKILGCDNGDIRLVIFGGEAYWCDVSAKENDLKSEISGGKGHSISAQRGGLG